MARTNDAPHSGATSQSIVVEGLRKAYHGTEVLHDVSLSFEPGKFVTILGPSGSGKTTILRCLAGLENPDGGRILINGIPVFDAGLGINVPSHRRRLGMIFQNYALWPHMTVLQHVLFPLQRLAVPGQESLRRATDALESVGLAGHATRFPHQLSGGQQQRVAIARAIVTGPGVLLMDEPLSNLDARLRHQLRQELKLAHLRSGATSVFVTHDQADAFVLSDHLVVMKDGRIRQQGTVAAVRSAPETEFVARFLGHENIFHGHDINRIFPDAGGGRFEPGRLYVLPSAALRLSRQTGAEEGLLHFKDCRLLNSVFDGQIYTSRLETAGFVLETRSLDAPVTYSDGLALSIAPEDVIAIG